MAAGLCLGIPDTLDNMVVDETKLIMTVCTDSNAAKWDFVKVLR